MFYKWYRDSRFSSLLNYIIDLYFSLDWLCFVYKCKKEWISLLGI